MYFFSKKFILGKKTYKKKQYKLRERVLVEGYFSWEPETEIDKDCSNNREKRTTSIIH